jgi:hypothetical protein
MDLDERECDFISRKSHSHHCARFEFRAERLLSDLDVAVHGELEITPIL